MRSKRRLLGRNDDNFCHLLSPLVNNFGERMEGAVHPKGLTLPVDNLLLKRELVAVHLDKALPTYTSKEAGFLPKSFLPV